VTSTLLVIARRHGITADRERLVEFLHRHLEAARGLTRDALGGRLQHMEKGRLLAAAERSAEKLREQIDELYEPPLPAFSAILSPVIAWWHDLLGRDPAEAPAATELIVREYAEESARLVNALLARRRPGADKSLHSEVETLCTSARWTGRAHRLEERLAREAETALSDQYEALVQADADLREAEDDAAAAERELASYEAEAREYRHRDPTHPMLSTIDETLDDLRASVRALRTATEEARR
jgi:hypothetical protein